MSKSDNVKENYQIRLLSGEIKFFETLPRAIEFAQSNLGNVEKLSFNGPDGTRIRILFSGASRFLSNVVITYWKDTQYVGLDD